MSDDDTSPDRGSPPAQPPESPGSSVSTRMQVIILEFQSSEISLYSVKFKIYLFYVLYRDGDFVDFSAFVDFFFSASNLPHFCRFLQFGALIRESERNAEKRLTK